MPDCSEVNIAGIAGRLGPPGDPSPVNPDDVKTLANCQLQSPMAAAIMRSRGNELSLRAQTATQPSAPAPAQTNQPGDQGGAPAAGDQSWEQAMTQLTPSQSYLLPRLNPFSPPQFSPMSANQAARYNPAPQPAAQPPLRGPGPGGGQQGGYTGTGPVINRWPQDIVLPDNSGKGNGATVTPAGEKTPAQRRWDYYFNRAWSTNGGNSEAAAKQANVDVAKEDVSPGGAGAGDGSGGHSLPVQTAADGGGGDQSADPAANAPGSYDPNQPLAEGTYAAGDPSMGGYQDAIYNSGAADRTEFDSQMIDYLGGRDWMKAAGLSPTQMNMPGMGPVENPTSYLNAYAEQAGLPAWWGAQNKDLYQTLPGLYQLANPGSNPNPTNIAGMAQDIGPGQAFGTPGKYLDTNAEWDRIFAGGGGMTTMPGTGVGTNVSLQTIATMDPAHQEAAVKGAMGILMPWMTPDAAQGIAVMMDGAVQRWKDARTKDAMTPDLFTYLRTVEHADQWM